MKRVGKAMIFALVCLAVLAVAAGCEKNFAKITYVVGDEVHTQSIAYGSELMLPSLVKEGYRLDGWYKDEALTELFDPEGYKVETDVTLYAEWVKGDFTVTFSGAEGIKSQIVVSGGTAIEPAVKAAAGVEFVGWYSDEEKTQKYDFSLPVTEDITLYALFIPKDFSVTYDAGYPEGNAPVQGEVAYDGSFIIAEAPERTGYVFTGWTDGADLYQPGDTYHLKDEKDIVLVACWETAVYKVEFRDDTGKTIAERAVPYGGAAVAPSRGEVLSSRAHYVFSDWDADFGYVTGDMVINALYEYVPSSENYFDFTLREDGESYALSLKANVNVEELALPAEHEGLPVTEIAHNGFEFSRVTSVYIPYSYKIISYEAFFSSGIQNVEIEEGLEYIDHCAFQSSSIKNINFPASLKSIGYFVFDSAYSMFMPELSEENIYLVKENDMILSADKTKLYFFSPMSAKLVVPASVTFINPGICSRYNNLQSVVIEGDVEEIASASFYQCYSLTELIINGSVKRIGGEGDVPAGYEGECELPSAGAFMNCNLKSIRLPGVRYIGAGTFQWNFILEEIYIDNTIEFLGDNFVDGNRMDLKKVAMIDAVENDYYVIENNTVIEKNTGINGGDTFMMFIASNVVREYSIPESVTSIRPFAFYGAAYLEKVTVPEGVEEIFAGTFMMENTALNPITGEYELLTELTEVNLPSTLKRITSDIYEWVGVELWGAVRGAFLNCIKLRYLNFYNGCNLEVLGDNTFAGACIESFHIPASLTEIGIYGLPYDNLRELTVDEDNPAFAIDNGVLYNKDFTELIIYPALKEGDTYAIPEGVMSIRSNAFYKSKYIKEVIFPSSVRDIGNYAFSNSNIEVAELNEGVVTIGKNAFYMCNMLRKLVLPSTLETIMPDAFINVPSLEDVEFKGTEPPAIYTMEAPIFISVEFDPELYQDIYSVNENLVIKVPQEAFRAYYEQFAGYGFGLCDKIALEGVAATTFIFNSNGGSEIESVTGYAVSDMPIPEMVGSSLYFYGWYLIDGRETGEWGERAEFPYFGDGREEVVFYARWETERYQDGTSFLFAYTLTDEPVVYTLENSGYVYFIYTASATGRAYLRYDLEGLFLGYSAFTVPEQNYDYWLPSYYDDDSVRYWDFVEGETYYIIMMNFSIDGDYSVTEITSSFYIEIIVPENNEANSISSSAAAILPRKFEFRIREV